MIDVTAADVRFCDARVCNVDSNRIAGQTKDNKRAAIDFRRKR